MGIREQIRLILSDGNIHSREELLQCFNDPLATPGNLNDHIVLLRKELPPGQEIYCVTRNRRFFYVHARKLASANDGKY